MMVQMHSWHPSQAALLLLFVFLGAALRMSTNRITATSAGMPVPES